MSVVVGLAEGLLVGAVGEPAAAPADGVMVGFRVGGTVGAFDKVGCMVGLGTGWDDGNRVGWDDGDGDDGAAVGSMLGKLVGASVGTGVGGLVYSTTIVAVLTAALFVAFLFTVTATPVTFAAATSLVNRVVRLPLVTADDICEDKALDKFAALPTNPAVVRRRPSSSCVRATTPSSRISRRNFTSTSFKEEAPVDVVAFTAWTLVT